MQVLEHYISELQRLQREGRTVAETTRYGLLEVLLNEVGGDVNAHAETHLRDTGAGIPDLGIFDEKDDQKPAHGVVEAKPTSDNVNTTAKSEQVERYAAHYGQVLVTNFYQFLMVIRESGGNIIIAEKYLLADTEKEFYETSAKKLAAKHGAAFREYLLRVMRRNTLLSTPQDVAWILASYAREAKARISREDADLSALEFVREQLEQALGVKFEQQEGKEFFQSTMVQTLFYGIFSAWVLWNESHPAQDDRFDLWRDTRDLNLPAISEMFNTLATPARLRPLDIEDLLDYTAQALNRVDRGTFFDRFGRGDAVQYFYEPFLEAFDPDLRRQLGVWYTPREVVEYMVARVDDALRDQLNIPDGLADPRVVVLDPCCGTGAYLVEVLGCIYDRLERRDGAVLAAQAVNEALQRRVFGFELLPAPFVVAHLQIGTLLADLQAPLKLGERAGVYLTNALTRWQKADAPQQLALQGLEKERDAADNVKREQQILVILGNPPYSGYAGIAVEQERELTEAYRKTINAPAPRGQGLNDLYIRFYRMAERRIVEQTQQGIVCFISNYSWLDGLSHTGMREHYLDVFDTISIDSLNGDSRRTGKVTPDGKPDPSVFSTEFNREGIQVGTAIALMVRHEQHEDVRTVQFRDLWGTQKRANLRQEVDDPSLIEYEEISPEVALGYPFMPRLTREGYLDWPRLPDLFPRYFPGVKTSRDDALVEIDNERLTARMERYFDPSVGNEEIHLSDPDLMKDLGSVEGSDVRNQLVRRGFLPEYIVNYCYRPFDIRWLYWEPESKLLDAKRADYFPHVRQGNIWIISQQMPRRDWSMPQVIQSIGCLDLMDRSASCFPLYLYQEPEPGNMFAPEVAGFVPNLSDTAKKYVDDTAADEKYCSITHWPFCTRLLTAKKTRARCVRTSRVCRCRRR